MSYKDVRIAALNRLSSLLDSEGYSKLCNVFDVEENPENLLDKGYGVRWSVGRSVSDITRKITTSGNITVILTYGLSVRPEDNVNIEIDELYADIDTIVASFFNATLLGIPDKLLIVEGYSLQEPRLVNSRRHVKIEVNFDLRFRTAINY